jgi:hypothetical protein
LEESPAVAAPPLGLAAGLFVRALADACQILNGDSAPALRRAGDDVLADAVVLIALEAPFPASEAFLESADATPRAPCPLAGFLLMMGPAAVVYVIQSVLQADGLSFAAYRGRFGTHASDDVPALVELVEHGLAVQGVFGDGVLERIPAQPIWRRSALPLLSYKKT